MNINDLSLSHMDEILSSVDSPNELFYNQNKANTMEKNEKYSVPQCEEVELKLEGVIAMSGENEEDGGDA